MPTIHRVLALLATLASAPTAQADTAGDFDFYVLALSWSPTWCALEGDARDAEQCHPDRDHGWTLHGLWPQYEVGYPADCRTDKRDPSRQQSGDMADIMGSGGLAWYQWKKHGRCTGLDGPDYYALSRLAYDRVARPEVLRQLDRTVSLPASVVEEAFLEANPDLAGDMIRVTCEAGRIDEIRVCLTRELEPRACSSDMAPDCTLERAILDPIP
ncbi:MAG: ribonuclease T2 [Pseudomonadota bacterium]